MAALRAAQSLTIIPAAADFFDGVAVWLAIVEFPLSTVTVDEETGAEVV